jgi:hypothetical protein
VSKTRRKKIFPFFILFKIFERVPKNKDSLVVQYPESRYKSGGYEYCSLGIFVYDGATGIRWLTNADTKPSDYARLGHISPLRAKTSGVLRRKKVRSRSGK